MPPKGAAAAATTTEDETKQPGTDLAVQRGGAVGVFDYGDDEGAGHEGLGREDFLVPMLDIVQPNSNEVTASEGAIRPGQLIIRTLGETYDGKRGVVVIPCGRQHMFVRWRPKDAGGGIVEQYTPDDPFVAEVRAKNGGRNFGKMKVKGDPNDKLDDDLVETFYLFGVLGLYGPETYDIEDTRQIVIPFASTKISPYRQLMTKAGMILVPTPDGRKIRPPLYAHRFRLSTFLVEKGGNKWYNYKSGFDGPHAELGKNTALTARIDPRTGLYEEARAMYQMIQEGVARVDTRNADNSSTEGHEGAGPSAGAGGRAKVDDKDIPF